MKTIAKYALGALMTGAVALGAAAPAQAGVGVSIGIGGPAYYGYNYYQPCRFYFNHDLPAPNRCLADYRRFYGPSVYISDGFIFRDRVTWGRWRDRDDFRHWRAHDWRGHDHDWHDHDGDHWHH
ncbi:MAG TPA: hypothetical protein VGG10_19070 [Rhizomicrobium sp.]|jgi:hypothetical protein